MKEYEVIIPIAGHAFVTVEAESEDDAKEKAFEKVTLDHVESWEPLERFNQGNICYCPSPWEVEVECNDEEDE